MTLYRSAFGLAFATALILVSKAGPKGTGFVV